MSDKNTDWPVGAWFLMLFLIGFFGAEIAKELF